MACSACSRRAATLLPKMGFLPVFDPARDEAPVWTSSNTFVTVSFKLPALLHRHTRVAILAWIAKLLFGSLKPMIIRRTTEAEIAALPASELTRQELDARIKVAMSEAQARVSVCLPPCSYNGAGQCVDLLGNPCA